MFSHSISITDADAAVSGVLWRTRLDGLDQVPVPFEGSCVHAWRRGAPDPDMDLDTLINVLRVRCFTPSRGACHEPWMR